MGNNRIVLLLLLLLLNMLNVRGGARVLLECVPHI
tara:strand:+ start:171 stop:275 length:105 start_codon:yes stop_codon:yes gene_type:complete